MKPPILLDTNLLVLLTIGSTDVDLIKKHKRSNNYAVADFDLLVYELGDDPRLILMPNILSETSNLIRQHEPPEVEFLNATLAKIIALNKERFVQSKIVIKSMSYVTLGLTDAAILCCPGVYEILTNDRRVHQAAEELKIPSRYFHYARVKEGLVKEDFYL